MFGQGHKSRLRATLLILFITVTVYASVTGPEARYTGAPGDINSCIQCHDTFDVADIGTGSVSIDNLPAVYQPGQQYNLTVSVKQAGRARYGFQLTALDGKNLRAGSLAPLGTDSQMNPLTGEGGRQYLQHTQAGTPPNGQGSRTWQVRWTAPSTDLGTVTFYAAGNAANGDGTNQGDYIYTTKPAIESPTTAVVLSLESHPDGLTLEGGSKYTITWSATNRANINNVELRYSTDDGATFPVTKLIRSTTDAAETSYEWTVPNITASQVRLRLSGGTKSGAAIPAITTGRFSISGTGEAAPRIDRIEIKGKKLYIFGENFQDGAVAEINGVKEKTSNDDDLGRELKCKKAGKKIAPAQEVTIVVKNPDGNSSEPFQYKRPDE